MISKRILISMIVIISLAQFITCPGPSDPAAGKSKGPPKSEASKSGSSASSVEPGMDPDDKTEIELEKPNGLRQKIVRPIKYFFWPMRYVFNKYKNFMNKVLNKYNKRKEKSATLESDGEKPLDKNKTN